MTSTEVVLVGTWYHGLELAQDRFVLSVASVFMITGMTQVTVRVAPSPR